MASDVTALDPSIIVIFGITGDLSKRYLLPALYHLFKVGLLDERSVIVGISRRDMTAAQLLDGVELCHEEPNGVCDPDVEKRLRNQTRMVQMDLGDQQGYHHLHELLDGIEAEAGICMNRLYYLSIPPVVYEPIVGLMGQASLQNGCQHGSAASRLLVEKPFGYDTSSASTLIDSIGAVFKEDQLFRIDHYLAKETVQNILTFRFDNPIFEAIWDKDHIEHIEIIASEQIGIMGRAVFYEPLGALRDFIQSHLLQLLAIVTMDKPAQMDSDHIHEMKQQLLDTVRPVGQDAQGVFDALRGQYQGYREEVDNMQSVTETFAAIRTTIDNDRWRNVPIIIWTGKGLGEKRTEIIVAFRNGLRPPNRLRFRISPSEGIEVELLAKKPGYATELEPAIMDFSYDDSFEDHRHPNAYERVLVDAIRGDHTLFATSHEVMAAWQVVQPVLDAWQRDGGNGLIEYAQGHDGEPLARPLFKGSISNDQTTEGAS